MVLTKVKRKIEAVFPKQVERYHIVMSARCLAKGIVPDIRNTEETIQKLLPQKVDITLGNHPNQNNTLGKRQYMLEHPGINPFVDPEGWPVMLRVLEEKRQIFEELGY